VFVPQAVLNGCPYVLSETSYRTLERPNARHTHPNLVANSTRSVKLANELVSTADVRNPSYSPGAQYTCRKSKGKEQAIKAQRGERYSSTLSLILALDGAGWSTPRPGRFTPGKEAHYPSYRRLGGSQGRYGRVRKISPPTLIRSPELPARSESLYRLSYPILRTCRIIYICTSVSLSKRKLKALLPPRFVLTSDVAVRNDGEKRWWLCS